MSSNNFNDSIQTRNIEIKDITYSHQQLAEPTSATHPAVFFQWEIDHRDGRRVLLDAEGMETATLRYGLWNDRSQDVSRTVNLPYILNPEDDHLSTRDGEYYVFMLGFDQIPTERIPVVAKIIQ